MLTPVPTAADFDPAAELRDLAARQIEAHKAEPGNAMLGRELRATLLALTGDRGGSLDSEAEAFLRGFAES